jgi:hypothetical protein
VNDHHMDPQNRTNAHKMSLGALWLPGFYDLSDVNALRCNEYVLPQSLSMPCVSASSMCTNDGRRCVCRSEFHKFGPIFAQEHMLNHPLVRWNGVTTQVGR